MNIQDFAGRYLSPEYRAETILGVAWDTALQMVAEAFGLCPTRFDEKPGVWARVETAEGYHIYRNGYVGGPATWPDRRTGPAAELQAREG